MAEETALPIEAAHQTHMHITELSIISAVFGGFGVLATSAVETKDPTVIGLAVIALGLVGVAIRQFVVERQTTSKDQKEDHDKTVDRLRQIEDQRFQMAQSMVRALEASTVATREFKTSTELSSAILGKLVEELKKRPCQSEELLIALARTKRKEPHE